jgi:hypothetical protein
VDGHRQVLRAGAFVLKDPRALLQRVCAAVEFLARQPACQQDVHAVDPQVAPLQRADEVRLLAGGAVDSDAGIRQRLTLDVRHREVLLLDLDARARRQFHADGSHLASLILSIDLDGLRLR